ncbi:hypothetical protein DFH06DRAFT_1140705 [Mycena polygramma]|nr:hypothetical protein DFH06DRAFT_1140705 [Mycena polygramma]
MVRPSLLESMLLLLTDIELELVLSYWAPNDVLKAAGLSRIMRGVVEHYKNIVWNIDRHLRRWFLDPIGFRRKLKMCGGVVSGSQIVQFFDRTLYPKSDMDVFMRVGGVYLMGTWLATQRYTLVTTSADYPFALNRQVGRLASRILVPSIDSPPPIRGVYNYQKFVASRTTVYLQTVQLICVDMDPVRHVLFDFHSTGVMNYMTWDRVVSLFPTSTFIHRKTYVAKIAPEPNNKVGWRVKYRERGFCVVSKRTRHRHRDLFVGKRTTADDRCWTMQLNVECGFDAEVPRSLLHRDVYGSQFESVRFDVIHWRSGVTQDDCFIRVGEPGVWRCISKVRRKHPKLLDVVGENT